MRMLWDWVARIGLPARSTNRMQDAVAILLTPGLLDSEITSLLTPLAQDLFAREPDSPAAQLLIAHGWDAATSQFTGPLQRRELASALVLTPEKASAPMDVDGGPGREPARSSGGIRSM